MTGYTLAPSLGETVSFHGIQRGPEDTQVLEVALVSRIVRFEIRATKTVILHSESFVAERNKVSPRRRVVNKHKQPYLLRLNHHMSLRRLGQTLPSIECWHTYAQLQYN